jgi:tetratricopeptide (TPR) repeat protein
MSFQIPTFFHSAWKKVLLYQKQILIGLSTILFISVVVTGHFFWVKTREERAHRALVNSLEYFNAPVVAADKEEETLDFTDKKSFANEKEKWEKVAEVFRNAHKKNKSSGIAAMFLAYYSEALINLDKIEEAIVVLSGAIDAMKNYEIREYYRLKLALMKIDSNEGSTVTEGLAALIKLAADEKSIVHDSALYNLGLHYWSNKNFDEAKNYWNQLLLKYGKDSDIPSPWAEKAEEKLGLIDGKIK